MESNIPFHPFPKIRQENPRSSLLLICVDVKSGVNGCPLYIRKLWCGGIPLEFYSLCKLLQSWAAIGWNIIPRPPALNNSTPPTAVVPSSPLFVLLLKTRGILHHLPILYRIILHHLFWNSIYKVFQSLPFIDVSRFKGLKSPNLN